MTIDTTDLIKALEERKRQLSKWMDKDRAKERIDEIDGIIDTDVPYLVKEESKKPVPADLEEAAEEYLDKLFGKGKHQPFYKELFIAGAKWQAEQDDKELSEKIASAYQLGLADKEKQMMKEAVEGVIDYVYDEKGDAYKAIRLDWLVGDFGDKVRVIVLPKEDEK